MGTLSWVGPFSRDYNSYYSASLRNQVDWLIAPNLENKAVIDKSAKNVCFHSQFTGSLLKHATQNMFPYILVYVCMCVCLCCVPTSLMCVLRMGTMPATVLNLSTSTSSTCSIHNVCDGGGVGGLRETEITWGKNDKMYGASPYYIPVPEWRHHHSSWSLWLTADEKNEAVHFYYSNHKIYDFPYYFICPSITSLRPTPLPPYPTMYRPALSHCSPLSPGASGSNSFRLYFLSGGERKNELGNTSTEDIIYCMVLPT